MYRQKYKSKCKNLKALIGGMKLEDVEVDLPHFGLVGCGLIGMATASELLRRNCKVTIYDSFYTKEFGTITAHNIIMGRIQHLIYQGIITKEMGVNIKKKRLKIANDINEFLTSNPQVIIQSLPDNINIKQSNIDEIRSINRIIPIGIQTMNLNLNTLNTTYITGVRFLHPVDRINDIMMTKLDDDKDNGAFDVFQFILTSLGPIPYNVKFPDNDNPKIRLSPFEITKHQEKSPPEYKVIEYGTKTEECAICLETKTQWYFSIFFRCGHYACTECSKKLSKCHICRKKIEQFTPMYVDVEEGEPAAPQLISAADLPPLSAPGPIPIGGKDKKKSIKKNLVKNLKKRLGKSCKKNLVKRSKRIYKSFKVI